MEDRATYLRNWLVDAYDLGHVTTVPIEQAWGRRECWRVESDQGAFVAKATRTQEPSRPTGLEPRVMRLVQTAGANVPRVLSTRDGETFTSRERAVLFVQEFLPGRGLAEDEVDYERYGTALAELHGHMDEVSAAALPQGMRELNAETSIVTSFEAVSRVAPNTRLEPMVQFLLGHFATLTGSSERLFGHGDAHLRNILATGDGHFWIDFEDAYVGPRLYDIATMVWSTLRQPQTQPLWSAGLRAYDRVRPLQEDLASLGPYVAVRHLWWLALHASAWGSFSVHQDAQRFFDAGVELLDVICRDACGMT